MSFSTRMDWNGREWLVMLFRGADLVATMTLDDWMKLSANQFIVDDWSRRSCSALACRCRWG
jgi:hypothetical protein